MHDGKPEETILRVFFPIFIFKASLAFLKEFCLGKVNFYAFDFFLCCVVTCEL